MPATSEQQRKFMSLVRAYKRGEYKGEVSDKVKEAAASMSDEDLTDFMTKESGDRPRVDPRDFQKGPAIPSPMARKPTIMERLARHFLNQTDHNKLGEAIESQRKRNQQRTKRRQQMQPGPVILPVAQRIRQRIAQLTKPKTVAAATPPAIKKESSVQYVGLSKKAGVIPGVPDGTGPLSGTADCPVSTDPRVVALYALRKGPGAELRDGTGPHGRGLGPGVGRADGTGLEEIPESGDLDTRAALRRYLLRHRPDGTGPHGKGAGPGKGRADGTGMQKAAADGGMSQPTSTTRAYANLDALNKKYGYLGTKNLVVPRDAAHLRELARAKGISRTMPTFLNSAGKRQQGVAPMTEAEMNAVAGTTPEEVAQARALEAAAMPVTPAVAAKPAVLAQEPMSEEAGTPLGVPVEAPTGPVPKQSTPAAPAPVAKPAFKPETISKIHFRKPGTRASNWLDNYRPATGSEAYTNGDVKYRGSTAYVPKTASAPHAHADQQLADYRSWLRSGLDAELQKMASQRKEQRGKLAAQYKKNVRPMKKTAGLKANVISRIDRVVAQLQEQADA